MTLPRNNQDLYLALSSQTFAEDIPDPDGEAFGGEDRHKLLDLISPSEEELAEIESELYGTEIEDTNSSKGRKKKEESFLKRKDKNLWAGFLRFQIYKPKKIIMSFTKNSSEDVNCRCCNHNFRINDEILQNSGQIYLKTRDVENPTLSENILALLQIYDFVIRCSDCQGLNYGFIVEKVSFKDRLKMLSQKAGEIKQPVIEISEKINKKDMLFTDNQCEQIHIDNLFQLTTN